MDHTEGVEGLTDYNTVRRHVLASDLEPSSGSSTQIDTAPSILEEVVFFVELDELECGTRTVALLSGIGQLVDDRGRI